MWFVLSKFCVCFKVVIAGDNVEYSSKETQRGLDNLLKRMENLEYVAKDLYTYSWLRKFTRFYERKSKNNPQLNITTEQQFIDTLRGVSTLTNIIYLKI